MGTRLIYSIALLCRAIDYVLSRYPSAVRLLPATLLEAHSVWATAQQPGTDLTEDPVPAPDVVTREDLVTIDPR